MDGELRRKLLAEIDNYVVSKQMANSAVKIAEVMKPEVERLAKEYNVDMVDLFVAYMDHAAITSKRMSQEDENDIDITNPDVKLY